MSDTEPDPVFVKITLADVYNTLLGVGKSVDLLVVESQSAAKRSDDHELRLRLLERRVWSLPSLAAVLGLASLGISAFAAFR